MTPSLQGEPPAHRQREGAGQTVFPKAGRWGESSPVPRAQAGERDGPAHRRRGRTFRVSSTCGTLPGAAHPIRNTDPALEDQAALAASRHGVQKARPSTSPLDLKEPGRLSCPFADPSYRAQRLQKGLRCRACMGSPDTFQS